MSHPDFELYDNVGRDADQIHAHRYGIATRNDLHRWAKRDADPFLADHPLPADPLSAPDLAPYLDALAAAETPAEASAVTNRLLDAAEPLLNSVSDYLAAAARWRGQNRDAPKGSPPWLLRDAAGHLLTGLAMADHADLAILRAHYDPAPGNTPDPAPTRSPSGVAPTPPNTPPSAPPRGR